MALKGNLVAINIILCTYRKYGKAIYNYLKMLYNLANKHPNIDKSWCVLS